MDRAGLEAEVRRGIELAYDYIRDANYRWGEGEDPGMAVGDALRLVVAARDELDRLIETANTFYGVGD